MSQKPELNKTHTALFFNTAIQFTTDVGFKSSQLHNNTNHTFASSLTPTVKPLIWILNKQKMEETTARATARTDMQYTVCHVE